MFQHTGRHIKLALRVALKQKGLRPSCLNDPPSMAGVQPQRKFDKHQYGAGVMGVWYYK